MKSETKEWHKLFSKIDKSEFIGRRFSWIATSKDYFFKIPRISDSLEEDIVNLIAIEKANQQYKETLLLSKLDKAVQKPLGLINACLVTHKLTGNDLMYEVKSSSASREKIQFALEEGMAFCARLHKYKGDILQEIPVLNYQNNNFLHFQDQEIKSIESQQKTIVILGFEVRNFKREYPNGNLNFFDPHHLLLGVPEDDFCRYLLSLLMLDWGKNTNLFIWKNFDYQKLIDIYEKTREASLNHQILSSMFSYNIAMRQYNAKIQIEKMNSWKKLVAKAYFKIFFQQINAWRKQQGI